MPIMSMTSLVDVLRQYALLEPAQLEEVERLLLPQFPEPRALARELIQRGWLTPYQVNQIMQGHAADLVLSAYVVRERLGEGGMGQVFKAYQPQMGRFVALKVIRKERLGNPDTVRRFMREIKAASQLNHPNVIMAHDSLQVGERHVFVMEYAEGSDLNQIVKKRGPLPVAEACDYIRQTTLGLHHAYERGLVHRDIKPSNLLLTTANTPEGPRPLIKILDMGLARITTTEKESGSSLTQEGTVVGTPDYMAPEQSRNSARADIRADLYSVGCTFYFLLTSRPPFEGETSTDVMLRHHLDPLPELAKSRPDVPPGIIAIIRKLMAKSPDDRYQTPALLIAALAHPPSGAALDRSAVSDATEVLGSASGATKAARRSRRVLIAGGAFFVLMVVLLAGLIVFWPKKRPDERVAATPTADTNVPSTGKTPTTAKPPTTAKLVVHDPSKMKSWSHLDGKTIPPDKKFSDRLVAILGKPDPQGFFGVACLAVSFDGEKIAWWGGLNHIVVWNVHPLGERCILKGPKSPTALAFAPDDKTLASGTRDLMIWDTAKGGEALHSAPAPGKGSMIRCLAFSAEGKTLASGSVDPSVYFWDPATGAQERSFSRGKSGGTFGPLAYSPDGKFLAVADNQTGLVRMTEVVGGLPVKQPRDFPQTKAEAIRGLAFSPDSKIVAAGMDQAVVFFDVKTGQLQSTIEAGETVDYLAYAPNGKMIATGTANEEVVVWDISSRKETWRVTLPDKLRIMGIAFAPDSKHLAAAMNDGTVAIFRLP